MNQTTCRVSQIAVSREQTGSPSISKSASWANANSRESSRHSRVIPHCCATASNTTPNEWPPRDAVTSCSSKGSGTASSVVTGDSVETGARRTIVAVTLDGSSADAADEMARGLGVSREGGRCSESAIGLGISMSSNAVVSGQARTSSTGLKSFRDGRAASVCRSWPDVCCPWPAW